MTYTDGYTGATSTNWANQVYSSISAESPNYNGLSNPILPVGSTLLDYATYISALSGAFYIIQIVGAQGLSPPTVSLNVPLMNFTTSGTDFIFEEVTYTNNKVPFHQGDIVLQGVYIDTVTDDFQVNMSQIQFTIPPGSIGTAQIADLAITNAKLAQKFFEDGENVAI